MLDHTKNYWHQLIDALAQGIVIIDQKGKILYVNHYASQLFGRTSSDLIGTDFLYPLSAEEVQEIEILNPDNEVLTAQMTVREGAWQDHFAWIVSLHDISELKKKEKLLSISSKGVHSAFEGIIITDEKGTILEANNAFLKMTGFKKNEIIGKNPRVWQSGRQGKQFYKDLWATLLEKGHWSGELWDKKKNNKIYPVFLSISAVKNPDGDIVNYIGFFHDLSVIKKQEQQIEHVKHYDLLTGLPNSFLLTQRLERCMWESRNSKKNSNSPGRHPEERSDEGSTVLKVKHLKVIHFT